MNKWCEKEIEEMVGTIAKTTTVEEITAIFDVILTPREINDMARRLKIIEMLKSDKSYRDIIQRLAVSSSMISKVSSGVGLGFRRSNPSVKKKTKVSVSSFDQKRTIRYKGSPTLLKS